MNVKISELLKHFSVVTAKALQPLEIDFQCQRTEGLSQGDGWPGCSSLKTPDFSKIPGLFLYVARYADKEAILDLHYVDKEMLIECRILYPAHKLAFYPSLLLAAATIPRRGSLSGGVCIDSFEKIEQVVTGMGSSILDYWKFLREPGQEVFDRALVMQGREMKFAQEDQRRKNRDAACIKASAAFHSGNHRLAVKILGPFLRDDGFPETSKKLYDMALKLGD